MKRFFVLCVIVLAGVLSQGAVWYGCAPAEGEHRLEIEKVRDNLYTLTGGGGTTAVFVTARGVVLVDTKLGGWGPAVLQAVRTISDRPISIIINTHTHADHTGGNAAVRGAAEIVTQQNTAVHMEGMSRASDNPTPFLPSKTFHDRLSLLDDEDRIDLYYFGAAHTNGDAIVVFAADRVAHMGDLFADKAPPIIDLAHGGSGVAFPATLRAAAEQVSGVDEVITGHGPRLPWSDVRTYADFNQEFLDWTRQQFDANRAPEAVAKTYPWSDKFAEYAQQAWQLQVNMRAIYEELRPPAPPPQWRWRGTPP